MFTRYLSVSEDDEKPLGPARSSIFSLPPPDPLYPNRTLRRRRVLAHLHDVHTKLTEEERVDRAEKRSDPLCELANAASHLHTEGLVW